VSIERRGPSASQRFAQDDGVCGAREELFRQVQKRNGGFSWLKGSDGFGGVEAFEVLRLRCASLRMTGVCGGERRIIQASAKANDGFLG
jgi:hypothetical protein